jgi:hypothetical protein
LRCCKNAQSADISEQVLVPFYVVSVVLSKKKVQNNLLSNLIFVFFVLEQKVDNFWESTALLCLFFPVEGKISLICKPQDDKNNWVHLGRKKQKR